MCRLEGLLVCGQGQRYSKQTLRLALLIGKMSKEYLCISMLEIKFRLLDLILVEHITIVDGVAIGGVCPDQVINTFYPLQIHSQTLDAVCNLARGRHAIEAANLLEIGKLRDLHTIEPDLPTQTPGPEGGVLPIILDEAYIVLLGIDTQSS